MKRKYRYQVIEDNGGGLTLAVFWGRTPIYVHSGYEYNPGQLTGDLDELDSGTDIDLWEGGEPDPQAVYDALTSMENGWQVVCERKDGKRRLYKHLMGRAAMLEFNVTDEERDLSEAAAALGRRTSERKRKTARENGKKGGRPRRGRSTYRAWAQNDQGASTDVAGGSTFASVNAAASAARSEFGPGWKIKIEDEYGQIVKEFTVRR